MNTKTTNKDQNSRKMRQEKKTFSTFVQTTSPSKMEKVICALVQMKSITRMELPITSFKKARICSFQKRLKTGHLLVIPNSIQQALRMY
jgi:hypothetical protein